MKLIFVHIPKTAGSSFSKFLESNLIGAWLPAGDLKNFQAKKAEEFDYLAGHFTVSEVYEWSRSSGFDLSGVKFVTAIRNPFDQLLSNLSYPFELQKRQDPKVNSEYWMQELCKINPNDPYSLEVMLTRFPFITGMQYNYIVADGEFKQRVGCFDKIAIFPDAMGLIEFAARTFSISATSAPIHENKSKSKIISKGTFKDPQLRRLILALHAPDIWFYQKIKGEYDEQKNIETVFDEWLEN